VDGYARVGTLAEFPPGAGRLAIVDGRHVAIFHLDDGLHALDNLCLHRAGPLCDGPIDNGVVTCPWHGWSYDIRTGTLVQDPRVGVSRYEVRVQGTEVSVRLTA
jgi:nitrite reductase/ring-hydroxylating ferredoxin subunit